MRLTLLVFFTLLSGCAGHDKAIHSVSSPDTTIDRADSYWTEERKAMYRKASEGARQSRERYIEVERPALRRQLRQQYPTMTEADLELLVNEALEKGLRPEAGRQPDGPIRQRQMDCMSSAWRNSVFSNCY